MTRGKQKVKRWNPFKRSGRKQKVLEDGAWHPYENGLYSQSSVTDSRGDSFSVTFMTMNNEVGECDSNGSAMDLPTQGSRTDQEESQPTLETTKIIDVGQPSFDSLLASALEADLEEPDLFNKPFMPTRPAPRQVAINPQIFEDHNWQRGDPEDFKSVLFDPRNLSQEKTEGTPTSIVLHAARSAKTSNDDENMAYMCGYETENEFLNNGFSEFKSPVNQKVNPNFFQKGDRDVDRIDSADDPPSLSNDQEKDENLAPFGATKHKAQEKRQANKQGEVKDPTPEYISMSKQNYRSLLIAKRRKSTPFRSALKNVLVTKAQSNVIQVKSPSCQNTAKVESRGEAGKQGRAPNTPRTNASQTTPTAGTPINPTTPRSKKIRAKSKCATPRSSGEVSNDEKKSPESPLSADHKARNVKAEGQTELMQPTTPSMASSSPLQHPSDEKPRAHRETPRSSGISIVQSKSEIPDWGAPEDCLIKGMDSMCATTQNFEIQNLRLHCNSGVCCRPLTAKKQIQGDKSVVVSKRERTEQTSASTCSEFDRHTSEGKSTPPSPLPPPPPPLPITLPSSLKHDQLRLLTAQPPPPPPKPETPPRLVVVKTMRKQALASRETMETLSQPQGSGGADAEEIDEQNFEQLEVFLQASPDEKIDPAANASNIMQGTLTSSQDYSRDIIHVATPTSSAISPPSLDNAAKDLTNILEESCSFDRVDTCSTGLSQSLPSGSGTETLNGQGKEDSSRQPKCRLCKKIGNTIFLKGKIFPLPRHQTESIGTIKKDGGAPFGDWFGTQHSNSLDLSKDESPPRDTWMKRVPVGEVDQWVPKNSAATATFASGLVKTPTSNHIYWSASTDDFEVVAVTSSKKLPAESAAFSNSTTEKPSTIAMARKPFPQPNEGAESSSPESAKMEWETGRRQGTKKVIRPSPCNDKALSMLALPGVESKTPKIGDTVAADLCESTCSTLSDSSSSSGSAFSCSYLDSDNEGSYASDSAILTPSLLARHGHGAIQQFKFKPRPTLDQMPSISLASTSNSNENIFRNTGDDLGRSPFRDASVHSRAHGLSCTTSNSQVNHSMRSRLGATRNVHRNQNSLSLANESVSTSSSADNSSTDSRSESNDVEAHIQMAQEWMQKIKAAILGDNDDDSKVEHGSIGNNVQCEYAGVLGRLKIDINRNK